MYAAENSSSTWGPSQTPGSGWDDDTPAQPLETTLPRNAGRGNVDSIRGRSGSNRGRGFAPMRPEPARHMADVDSAMPGATWDDDLPVPSSQVCDMSLPVTKHAYSYLLRALSCVLCTANAPAPNAKLLALSVAFLPLIKGEVSERKYLSQKPFRMAV